MPKEITLPGGGVLNVPDEATPEQIQQFLDENYNQPEGPGFFKTAGEHAAASAIPNAAFAYGFLPGAKIGAKIPGPPLVKGIGAFIGGTASGMYASRKVGQAQEDIAQATLPPELYQKAQQELAAGQQAHPWGAELGSIASFGLSAKPSLTTKHLPFRAALATAYGLGMPLIEGQTPTVPGVVGAIAGGTLFGGPRGIAEPREPAAPRPEVSREEQAKYYQLAEQKIAEGGRKLNKLSGTIPGFPNDVFHAREDGSVDVSLPNLDKYLHKYIDPGIDKEGALDRAVTEELTHAAQFDLGPEARGKAASYWNDYTAAEKSMMKKIIMGDRPTDPEAAKAYDARSRDDAYLGLESSRYWMQRMSDIGPTEMSALQAQGESTVRMMDRLLGFVRWLRNAFGTKANERQKEYFKSIETNAERAKKGAQDASSKPGPAGVPQREEGTRVGEEARVRQSGQTPEAQAKRLEELRAQKVLLGPDAPMEGEKILRAAVVGPGNKVATGPHHPGILEKLGVKGFEERESRNTPDFGYETNRRRYVPRDLGTKIAEKSGQDLREFDEPIHSDQVASVTEPGKTVAEQGGITVPGKLKLKEGEELKLTIAEHQEYQHYIQQGFTPEQALEMALTISGRTTSPVKPQTIKGTTGGGRNPYAGDLFKARNAVQVLERAAAKDPKFQPELEQARSQLAEFQKMFAAAQRKVPPVTKPQGTPTSPSLTDMPVGEVGPATSPSGAISEANIGGEKAQGSAEQAWREHDEQIRMKLKAGGEMDREDRLKARELWKAALAENPDLAVEGAGVTMKGRAVPPYSEDEALEIAMGIFPEMPPKSLEVMVKSIVNMDEAQQDLYVNHLRIEKERMDQENLQRKIEAGTQKRLPIPPKSMAILKLSLHNYFQDTIKPIIRGGELKPEKVGTTYGGKEKITLPTVEPLPSKDPRVIGKPREPDRIRWSFPNPMDWLQNTVREPPINLPKKPDPYIVQASDRQLLQIYDETWLNYLHNAPSEELAKLRQAHRLDRLDLKGDIPEPEMDPLIRILQTLKHGEMEPEKMEAMAKWQQIDTSKKGWEKQLEEKIRERVEERLPDLALAKGIDISVPGWEKNLLRGLLKREKEVGKARAEYLEPAKTPSQLIKLVREFNDANNARQRKRARLERMLAQRGSSEMFIARKSPTRSKITADDIQITEGKSEVGPYAQFALIKDIDSDALDYLGHGTKIGEDFENTYTPQDLADFNRALVEGEGGIGANATKRITLLYDTKTGNLEAVSTYRNDTNGKAMIYDPRGEPGKRDRDHLRIPKVPSRYRIFGTMLVRDPVGYFHQRWTSDETGSGLKKFWFEIGEVANGAAEGDRVWRRITKIRAERREKEEQKKLIERTKLSEQELKAKGKLEELYADMAEKDEEAQAAIEKAEQQELDEAHKDTKETLEDQDKEQKDPEEFSVKQLADYQSRLARLQEMMDAGDIEDIEIGPKVSKMDRAALQEFEERSKRGMIEQAKANLMAHDISHQEARELAYLFYRFKLNTGSRATFKRDLETALGYLHDSLAQEVSGRNYSVFSAIKKIAAFKYKQIVRGKGLAEELKYYIEDHPKISKERATKNFYAEKQQRAFEYALEEIRDTHIATRAELDQLPRRTARIPESQTTPDFPLFPDRFAWRLTEAFGNHSARYLEALSVSPQRAADRAVRELTDSNQLHRINLPDWVISRDPKTAAARAKWLKTGEGLSWLRSPEGQKFLRDAGSAIVSSKRITDRLSAASGLVREITGQTGKGKIPTGKMPEPVFPETKVSPYFPEKFTRGTTEPSSTEARPRWPAPVGSQLVARSDMHNVATELGDLENKIAVPNVPEKNWPTLRNWLVSPEGKKYLKERWGIRQKPNESVVDLHDRLTKKLVQAVDVEDQIRGREMPGESPWQKLDPDIEMKQAEPGLTMKEHVSGRQRREEQSAALGLPPPSKTTDSLSMEELIALGPNKFAGGGLNSNPYQVRERITRTGGQISTTDASLLLWWDKELQKDADRLANDPKYGKNSPEYQEAEKDWLEWRDWEQNVAGRTASETMRVRQGVQDLDTGSWAAMRSELRRVSKGQASSADEAVLEGMVNEQHELNEDILHAEEKVKKERVDILSMPVGEEQKPIIKAGADYIEEFVKQAEKDWHRDEGTPMAMRGGKADPLTPQERDSLIAKGIREMSQLSASDSLSEASWRKAMLKKYPNSAPFLAEIWEPARKMRDMLVAKAIGADKNTEIARRVLTREMPTPEESKKILVEAMAKNPGMRNISTAEAVHSWNFIKQKYFDKMDDAVKEGDFDTVLTKAAIDLGVPRERLYRSLIAKKSIRTITDELYRKMDKANRLRSHIRSWIDQKEHPWLVNVAKSIPGYFFMDKIFGHGFVGMITHASNLAFQPWAWKAYFGGPGHWGEGAWGSMYQAGLSGTWLGKKLFGDSSVGFHARMLKAIETDHMYRFAKRMGLECDVHRFRGDYEVGRLYSWMRKYSQGKGFDALKKLRLDLFKTWWDTVPVEQQTEQMGKLIANDVNHLTGIVHTKNREWANWTFFAPKLAASQWGVLIYDPLKAMGYLSHWKTSSPEQRAWAMSEVKHKAAMVGVYFVGLAINQALLKLSGSSQSINAPLVGSKSDPRKSDFMAFKVGGFDVGVSGPMIQIVRLFSDMIHIGLGEQSALEKTRTRQSRMWERMGEYGRRKFSPFASFAVDVTTGQDFTGRPLPWSKDTLPRARMLRGVRPYSWAEYGLQTISPIPIEEAVKEVWRNMGMDNSTASKLWRALAVSAPTALTGARIWEDPYAESEPHAVRGPATSY